MILLPSLLFGLLAFCLVVLLFYYITRNRSTDIFHRLRRHHLDDSPKKEEVTEDLLRRLYRYIKRSAKPFVTWNIAQKLELKIKQAGLPLLGAEFIIIALLGSLLAGLFVYMLFLDRSLAIAAALIVPLLMWLAVLMKISKRSQAFTEQLGDCLTTTANALRAGYSFQQAMEVIAKEMEPPISDEFAHVTTDISMGVTLETALEQMNKRVGSADFDLVVTAVLIQREVGGNLAQILDTISDTINERIRMKREVLALTAQGRLSAMVLMALPFVTAGAMYTMNRDALMMLFEEPMGRMLVAGSVVLMIIGFVIIQKIVDIDA